MSGEIAGYVMEKLFEEGALDVFYTPIYMKKNRPAIKMNIICQEKKLPALWRIILRETTSIGLRFYEVERVCMEREEKKVENDYGTVSVKVASYEDIIKYDVEYEDCKRIAKEKKLPLKTVYENTFKYL